MRFAAQLLIRLYQWTLSPYLGSRCRFYPSCSHYAHEAIGRFGVFAAVGLRSAAPALPSFSSGRPGPSSAAGGAMNNPRVMLWLALAAILVSELPGLGEGLRRDR